MTADAQKVEEAIALCDRPGVSPGQVQALLREALGREPGASPGADSHESTAAQTYHAFTRIPPRQALLGVTPEKWAHDTFTADSEAEADALMDGLHVPLGGEVIVVPSNAAIRLTASIVTERA